LTNEPLRIDTPDDDSKSSGRLVIETPTSPTRPQPVTLICVRCEEEWTHPHGCDVVSGQTLVRVIRKEDGEKDYR